MNVVVDLNAHRNLEHYLQHVLDLIQDQRWVEAEGACDKALLVDKYHAEANHLAGVVAGQVGKQEKGLSHLHLAVLQNPSHSQYRYNYAVSLAILGRENEAAIQYQACLRLEPNHRDALWNYGEMLRMAEHFDLAAMLLERFAANGGNYSALNHRLGVIYSALRKDDAADLHFFKEFEDAKEQVDALTHWEYSLYLLSRERFSEGFAYYSKRFKTNGRNSVYCHDFGLPSWHGMFTQQSVLLIHGEQGLGDEMMFASIVPEVLAMARATESRVILAVKPGLVRLFAASFPSATVVSHRVGGPVADVSVLGKIDWQLPIGDLPSLFRFKLQDFQAARKTYLHACPQRTQWYAQQLAALEAPKSALVQTALPKLKVGLMWGSNPAAVNAKFMRWSQQRSVPVHMFERLAALLPHVQFVSLQNAERGHEAALAPKLDIFDLSHLQTDFLETASLVANLDLVISVDTSVSHLAGAMGKETWVPLIYRSDWRHGNRRKASYWYSNTKYFHQSETQNWAPVMDELAAELQLRVKRMHEKHRLMHHAPPASGLTSPINADLSQAVTFLAKRDFEHARPYFEKALAAQPNNPHAQWEFAMQLLTEEQWGRGWDLHEARHAIFGMKGLNMCPLPWPQWQGESLIDRAIVVHGEQGVGDEIMYLSMLPDLINTGARVILACVPSLVEIFQFNFPTIQVVPHPRGATQIWSESLPFWTSSKLVGHVDYQIPIASLGKYFRRQAADFPRRSYLRADEARVKKIAQILENTLRSTPDVGTVDKPFRIGLAWCGSLGDDNARARSMPVKRLQPLIDLGKSRGWQFVSLQSKQYAKQAAEVPEFELIDLSDHTDDFADLAALMSNLNLIISIDTSYGHLAAAMGLATWRMVIRTCDWRWGWDRDHSVWYANDRLFRQQNDGDWDTVVKCVVSELKKV